MSELLPDSSGNADAIFAEIGDRRGLEAVQMRQLSGLQKTSDQFCSTRAGKPLSLRFASRAMTGEAGGEVYHVLSDPEWLRLRRLSLNPDVCAVYIPKSALEKAFYEEGKQTAPVPVSITGKRGGFWHVTHLLWMAD